jgi:hypothetical protein
MKEQDVTYYRRTENIQQGRRLKDLYDTAALGSFQHPEKERILKPSLGGKFRGH